jgi:hypothetical protein
VSIVAKIFKRCSIVKSSNPCSGRHLYENNTLKRFSLAFREFDAILMYLSSMISEQSFKFD